ncbi:DNA gyrase inhibitor YacG [Halopseudomonas oceani]|uniref:DNA gyrase inhibitor YacG n=1 Tax=Halopseudomonas oceani TaxID=1708783 RepID=A0A2P4EY57_9GAMM|nr:DNA gyrase inhibitor YacG [Halopseudomonas oceani]POB05162.1 DNA gyrase inhibitor YacG [Halopseudomonas oceani]GGE33666.1 DNA gyrase inhibitor YacG [Halopseudomonas oceani]
MTLTVNCPTCKAPVTWDDSFPERPFCSHRCRLIDLGAWAAEEHVIEGRADDEQDVFSEDLPER